MICRKNEQNIFSPYLRVDKADQIANRRINPAHIFLILKAFRLTDTQFRRAFQIPVSVIISAVGVFWFVERVGFL